MRPIDDDDLLDVEAWDAPERLSPDDCLDETGADWRWSGADRDIEDER